MKKNVKFHTNQLKSDRNYRVVIRNLHHSIDIMKLKNEIKEYGQKVAHIHNVNTELQKSTYKCLTLIVYKKSIQTKKYDINFLQNMKVIIEKQRKKEISRNV